MLFLRCPSCGALLGKVQLLWELNCQKIDVLKISKDEKKARKAELAREIVTDPCCRGVLITYLDVANIIA